MRGGFVGACAAATAIGAHSLGGGGLPASPSLVVLVLACAVIGALASSAKARRSVPAVTLYLSVGQVVGHCVLAVAGGHTHTGQWSLPMLAAHLVAALGGAALICAAERLLAALVGSIWRLVMVLLALRGDEQRCIRLVWTHTGLAVRSVVCGGWGTRGPPPLAA